MNSRLNSANLKTVVMLSVVVGMLGCGKSKSAEPRAQQDPILTFEANTCPNAQNRERTGALRNASVEMIRETQRTIRRDCGRKVVSDKFEKTDIKNDQMTFGPTYPARGLKLRLEVQNRQTCDEFTARTDARNRVDEFTIPLNTSNGFFAGGGLRVLKNRDNILDYIFYACDPVREGVRCQPTAVYEQGTLRLSVTFTEQQIPTVREVAAKDCRRPRRH